MQQFQDFFAHFDAAFAAFGPAVVEGDFDTIVFAEFTERCDFFIGVADEFIDAYDDRDVEEAHIFDMFCQVGKALLQGFDIFFLQVLLVDAAVHLQGADRSDDDDSIRFDAGETALDVHELFGPQVGTETGFRNGDVPYLHGQLGGDDGVTAVGDVGERTAVDQGRCVFDGLDQVRFDGILHEDSHSPFDAELAGRDQIAVQVIGYGDVAHAFLEVHEVAGQAEGCHDFRCDSDHEVVFPRETADFAAHADDDVAQGPVVHVHDALPDDAAHVDAQGIALVDVIYRWLRPRGCWQP